MSIHRPVTSLDDGLNQDITTQIQQQFDPIIAACHHADLTDCKIFADILETFHESSKRHKTLRNLPKIMIRLYREGSLGVSEEELRKFYQLSNKRKQEIIFILYLIQDLPPAEIAEKVNLGDEKLSTKQKTRKIRGSLNNCIPSKRSLYTEPVTITHPYLNKQIHPIKNGDKKLEYYSYGSNELFWWLCPKDDCGHEWKAPIYDRSSGHGCPACARLVVTDKNRVTITHPHLKEQVHPIKNGTKNLEDFSYGSRERFWWLCPKNDCGYEWEAPITRRTRHGCPACAGKTVTDRNRVTITHPHLIKEVHPTKNGDKKLEDYSYGSCERFWWLCLKDDCGYEWEAPIRNRTNGRGCSACAGKTVTDRNRVTNTHPHLIHEVHPTKNGDKKLEDYSYGSTEVFWWLCLKVDCGQEWEATINNRTGKNRPRGCPNCAREKNAFGELWGKVEAHGENIVQTFFPNSRSQFRIPHKNTWIDPDNVVLLNPNAEINDDDNEFDLIIDPKQTPWDYKVKQCIGKYTPHCDILIIAYFYGHREKYYKHPDLLTGKTHNVEFLTFPELIDRLAELSTAKIAEEKRQELEEDYQRLVEFANNL